MEIFQEAIDKGWMQPTDELAINWWSIEDVDTYDDSDLSDVQKAKVWSNVMNKLSIHDDFDNDLIQRLISEAIENVQNDV
jgi:hypothetical protein